MSRKGTYTVTFPLSSGMGRIPLELFRFAQNDIRRLLVISSGEESLLIIAGSIGL